MQTINSTYIIQLSSWDYVQLQCPVKEKHKTSHSFAVYTTIVRKLVWFFLWGGNEEIKGGDLWLQLSSHIPKSYLLNSLCL